QRRRPTGRAGLALARAVHGPRPRRDRRALHQRRRNRAHPILPRTVPRAGRSSPVPGVPAGWMARTPVARATQVIHACPPAFVRNLLGNRLAYATAMAFTPLSRSAGPGPASPTGLSHLVA